MYKKIISIIICLIFFAPLGVIGQVGDFLMIDDFLFEDTEPSITLQSLNLYWSANSYTPFGYKGRALPTNGSLVTVYADLKISGESPENLKYSWFLDGFFQESKSGYNQNSFNFYIRKISGDSHLVLLKVFNESRSFLVEKSIEVPITSPEVVIYQKQNPKINLAYSISDSNFKVLTEQENSFLAFPYFFNAEKISDLEFTWSFANEDVKDSSLTANIFGMKITNKKVGGILEEILKVSAKNKKQTNQADGRTVKVEIY